MAPGRWSTSAALRAARACVQARFTPTSVFETQAAGSRLTPAMREMLVDWMADVTANFRLQQETFLLSVNYLDRCLPAAQHTSRLRLTEARQQGQQGRAQMPQVLRAPWRAGCAGTCRWRRCRASSCSCWAPRACGWPPSTRTCTRPAPSRHVGDSAPLRATCDALSRTTRRLTPL